MIFKIKGTIENKINQHLIVNIGSLSLEVAVPLTLIYERELNTEIELYTFLYVRENEFLLFGFSDLEQRKLFLLLINIAGIGPKSAMGILSQATVEDIKQAIKDNNPVIFTSVSGVGKKNANRIILELKSKFDQDSELDWSQLGVDQESQQVISALVHLGYTKKEAYQALRQINPKLPLPEKIKEGLQILGHRAIN